MTDETSDDKSELSVLGTRSEGIPFGAPGFMYAFFSLVASAGFTWISDYAGQVHHLLSLVCVIAAGGLLIEALLLLFFEPTLTLNEDGIRYRADKPSIWAAPPRLFRWRRINQDEQIPMTSLQHLELDFTTVPFPLPVFPFTQPFFRITRWMLTLKTSDGDYLLLDLGPSPNAFRDVLDRIREYTDLPLRTPWTRDASSGSFGTSWSRVFPGSTDLNADAFLLSLQQSDLDVRESADGALEVPIRNRLTWGVRSAGGMIGLLLLVCAGVLIFSGLQTSSDVASGLFTGIFRMVTGFLLGGFALLIFAEQISPFHTTLRFSQEGIQTVHPLRESPLIRYEELKGIRGVDEIAGSSTCFGQGKPTPCLEIYSSSDWLYLRLNRRRDLETLRELTEKLEKTPPVS